MNLLSCMDTFFQYDMAVMFLISMWYMWLVVYCVYAIIDPIIYFGGWRYYWMNGGNHICIQFLYFCIFGMHGWLVYVFIFISYICLCNAFRSLYHIHVYACVKGELHLKSPPKLFVITPYVLSSSKRGRLLAQRPLARSFDDNKPYVVMF